MTLVPLKPSGATLLTVHPKYIARFSAFIYSPLIDFSTFRRNVLAVITMTRVNLTFGRLGLHSLKYSSVARLLST